MALGFPSATPFSYQRRASSGGSASFRKVPNVSMASAYSSTAAYFNNRRGFQGSLSSSMNPRPCIASASPNGGLLVPASGGRGRVAVFEQDPQVVHRVGDAKSAARSRQRWAQAGSRSSSRTQG